MSAFADHLHPDLNKGLEPLYAQARSWPTKEAIEEIQKFLERQKVWHKLCALELDVDRQVLKELTAHQYFKQHSPPIDKDTTQQWSQFIEQLGLKDVLSLKECVAHILAVAWGTEWRDRQLGQSIKSAKDRYKKVRKTMVADETVDWDGLPKQTVVLLQKRSQLLRLRLARQLSPEQKAEHARAGRPHRRAIDQAQSALRQLFSFTTERVRNGMVRELLCTIGIKMTSAGYKKRLLRQSKKATSPR